jgi:hypothetical protein
MDCFVVSVTMEINKTGFKYILQVDVTKCHFVIVDKGGIVEICCALEWGVFYSCPYIVHILEYNK